MRMASLVLMVGFVILLPGMAFSQYGYVPECKESVARQMRISPLEVSADLGPYSSRQNRIVNWQTRRGRDRVGYCEFDTSTGELVQVQSGEYAGSAGDDRGEYGRRSYRDERRNYQGNVNAPSVRVDTSGHGTYHWPGYSVNITRGWVDTRGPQTTVALTGERDFKISFTGHIIRQNGDREFVMAIDSSDRGDARGTVTFRLNESRNEVEYINMSGRVVGKDSSGSFTR